MNLLHNVQNLVHKLINLVHNVADRGNNVQNLVHHVVGLVHNVINRVNKLLDGKNKLQNAEKNGGLEPKRPKMDAPREEYPEKDGNRPKEPTAAADKGPRTAGRAWPLARCLYGYGTAWKTARSWSEHHAPKATGPEGRTRTSPQTRRSAVLT